MDVGIRELKARLSELLARAENGETIRVTRRGKPQAQLGPIHDSVDEMPEWERRGIAEGWLRPANGEPPKFPKRGFKPKSGLTIQEMMDEDRGE